jgi:hypothetical protein
LYHAEMMLEMAAAICNDHAMASIMQLFRISRILLVQAMRALLLTACSVLFSVLPSAPLWADRVILTTNDLVEVSPFVWFAPRLDLPSRNNDLPILGPGIRQDGARLLRYLDGNEEINGFRGIIYDNRDRGHSTLSPEDYPQLAFLEYGVDLVAKGLDQGLAGRIFFPHVVLGNSSMVTGRGSLQRSLPRLAMTYPLWQAVTPALYMNNHVYVYPEHHDYDADDRFPINWPYMIISQGSSGSDRIFLSAMAMTLAAFQPDTFETLQQRRLVAPTLQMILRQNLHSVKSRADYLSCKAHPPVFDGEQVRPGRMVAQATDMQPEDIPPLVVLRVIEEDFSSAAGIAGLSERLLDSPAAIGRLWRSFNWEREMLVTVEDTVAVDDQPLTFEWHVLRGNPDRVQIELEDPDGYTARIRVAWHDSWSETSIRRETEFERRMSRVDIGVFANNGIHDSAPAFISIDFPEHQIRQYDSGANGNQLVFVDYDARGRNAYFDPLLHWTAPWTDTARYDENGVLLGWYRSKADGAAVFIPVDEAMVSIEDPQVDASNPLGSVLRPAAE